MRKITLEQLIAGAILIFGKVDHIDIKLLESELKKQRLIVIPGSAKLYIGEYIKCENGVYSLKDGYNMGTIISDGYTLAKELENVASTELLNVLFNMDINLFTLKKIKYLRAKVDEEENTFNEEERKSILNLLENHLIVKTWEGLAIYDEEQVFTITKKGEVKLFMAENPELIVSLEEMLKALRYDTSLIPEFLETQNLDTFTIYIETIMDFEKFCSIYDRDPRGQVQRGS